MFMDISIDYMFPCLQFFSKAVSRSLRSRQEIKRCSDCTMLVPHVHRHVLTARVRGKLTFFV